MTTDTSSLERSSILAREYAAGIESLDGDVEGRRAAWDRMAAGSAYYHGAPVAFDFIPKLYAAPLREELASVAHTTYAILCKVIEHYLHDPAYRDAFRFDPRVRDLVLLPSGYDEVLPMARFDMLLNESTGRFSFCEFNTDASSGMNESREALHALEAALSFQRFARAHALDDDMDAQFEGWVKTFERIWTSSEGYARWARSSDGEPARMAIVACLDDPKPDEMGELRYYMQLFQNAGFACSVFDVRELSFDGKRLIGGRALAGESNVPIDCIWRYCIVVDLLQYWDDVQGLVEALRARKVTMIGSFATQIAHDKQLFAVLRDARTSAFLDDDERAFVEEHIPYTAFLDDPALDIEAVRRFPAEWVIKPTDWYASKNVVVGVDCSEQQWNEHIDACLADLAAGEGSPFIVQRFIEPYDTPAIPLYGALEDLTAPPRPFGNLIGLYSHAGSFAGTYLRQGPHGVIGSAREGLVAPVLWVG